MQKREVKLNLKFEELLKTQPTSPVGEMVEKETMVYLEGKPVMGYFHTPPALLKELHEAVGIAKVHKTARVWGLQTSHAVFGVQPRNPNRNDYCRFTRDSATQKPVFEVLNKACQYFSEVYEKNFPENYKAALKQINQNVDPSWRFNKTPFLSLNINLNHAIKYHRDNGNFSEALSTVLIVKKNIKGGQLAVPELNLTLAQQDGAYCLFPGSRFIHGVLPIQASRQPSYRASIVFYSMTGLKHCYPYHQELGRVQTMAMEKFNHQKSPEVLAKLKKALLDKKKKK
jgi:hypothetical protein